MSKASKQRVQLKLTVVMKRMGWKRGERGMINNSGLNKTSVGAVGGLKTCFSKRLMVFRKFSVN